jgi:hypothetical protein
MASDIDRLDKVLAIAVNPEAYETEAVAALRAARQLIKKNPSLADPPRHPRVPTPKPAPLGEHSRQVRITISRRFGCTLPSIAFPNKHTGSV